jgi:hypothetical protein
MSVSDMFSGLGLDSGESELFLQEASTKEGTCNFSGNDAERSGHRIIDSVDLASIGSFDGDSMSLYSDTLHDFGSIVSLPAGTLLGLFRSSLSNDDGGRNESSSVPSNVDDGTRTIISSEPSGVYIPPPEASQDIWAISPHPQFAPCRARSIATVGSDYMSYDDSLQQDAASETKEDSENVGPVLSTANMLAIKERDDPMTSQAIGQGQHHHDSISFEAVANHLMREAAHNKGKWYANFTERDWEQFQRLGKIFLSTLQPQQHQSRWSPSLPPLPPSVDSDRHIPLYELGASYCASSIVPQPFVCPYCSDVTVGALALDCSCPASTVCTLCWEKHGQGYVSKDFSNQLGFVWVDNRVCPSCQAGVKGGVSCHALDVAILHIVQNLPDRDDTTAALKHHYFTRLGLWGEEVVKRHEEQNKLLVLHEDLLLAHLIQTEENAFWDHHQTIKAKVSRSTPPWLIFGQATVALLAATVASLSFNALSRR